MLTEKINSYLQRCQAASAAGKFTETIKLLDEMKTELRSSAPDSDEISSLFRELIANPSMPGASLVFVAAWSNLSQDYVSLLCEVLSTERLAAWHEQAVELLGELSNPDAVQALTKSLNYRWDFDEWLNIPRKALHSLASIGTEKAMAVILTARQSDVLEIRQEAAELLESQ